MVSWIKPYLDDVLSWFEFFARHFIEISSGDVTSHGTSNSWLAVLCCQFLPPAMQYLTDEVDHLERIIDLAVTTWVKESTAALPAMASASPENYALHVNANFRPILECVQHEITRSIVVERLNALDSKTVKGLVNSLYRLCTTWRTVSQGVYDRAPATVDSMMITDHIRVALAFCDMVPAFNRAFLRSGFSGMAIKLAQDFRLVPSSHTPNTPGGSKEASIGVEIASYFLGLTIPKPYELPIIVPEIIEAGLLNIIIDDILHPLRATSSTPFETWTYGPLQQDPLRHLVNLCSDPRICKALFSAIEVLPDSIHHAIFAKPKYKKAWGLFLTSAKAHDLALNAWSTEAVALCDNSTVRFSRSGRFYLPDLAPSMIPRKVPARLPRPTNAPGAKQSSIAPLNASARIDWPAIRLMCAVHSALAGLVRSLTTLAPHKVDRSHRASIQRPLDIPSISMVPPLVLRLLCWTQYTVDHSTFEEWIHANLRCSGGYHASQSRVANG